MSNIVKMPAHASLAEENHGGLPAVPINPYAAMREHARRHSQRMIIGKRLKHLGNAGRWVYGMKDEHELRLGTLVAVAWTLVMFGYIRFENGKVAEQHVGRVIEGYEPPLRRELGMLEQDEWPLGLDNRPTDPFQLRYSVPLKRVGPHGEIFTYVTTAQSANDRIRRVMDMIGDRGEQHPNMLPVVALGTEKFPTKYRSMQFAPVFRLKDWEPQKLFLEAYDAIGSEGIEEGEEPVQERQQSGPDPRDAYAEQSQSFRADGQRSHERHVVGNRQQMAPKTSAMSARDEEEVGDLPPDWDARFDGR
jgi:hypothetical protein